MYIKAFQLFVIRIYFASSGTDASTSPTLKSKDVCQEAATSTHRSLQKESSPLQWLLQNTRQGSFLLLKTYPEENT